MIKDHEAHGQLTSNIGSLSNFLKGNSSLLSNKVDVTFYIKLHKKYFFYFQNFNIQSLSTIYQYNKVFVVWPNTQEKDTWLYILQCLTTKLKSHPFRYPKFPYPLGTNISGVNNPVILTLDGSYGTHFPQKKFYFG